MVEKTSKVSHNFLLKEESASDDSELQKQLKKKLKKNSEIVPLSDLHAQFEPVQLLHHQAPSGGLQKTEQQPVAVATHGYSPVTEKLYQSKVVAGLSRQSLQKTEIPQTGKNPVVVPTIVVTATLDKKNAGPTAAKRQEKTTVTAPAKGVAEAVVNQSQISSSLAIQTALPVKRSNNDSSPRSTNADNDEMLSRKSQESGEARPLSHTAQPADLDPTNHEPSNHEPSNHESAKQTSKDSAVLAKRLQVLATQNTEIKVGKGTKSFEVNYQFKRWNGNHSVQVSLQTDKHRGRDIILQPSDVRAAHILKSKEGILQGFNTEIQWLQPNDEQEQRQRHRQPNPQADEESE